ncbi:tesB [Symbiodinium pilosum]|uniref:TesB protein n=1 Tax=Symbiodinium pilosum TaxID=2952 RepID=A0A812S0M9_SYMPI|nr:tesB [Symbiodinium pilosum]
MAVQVAEDDDHFLGQAETYGLMGIYGGHFVGQALAAGFATVEEPKFVQSLHCYFLLPGDPGVPIHYAVTRLREGHASDVRNIVAYQKGRPVFQMMASFKLPEEGDEHQPEMPIVRDVESLLEELNTQKSPFNPPPTLAGRTEMVLASDHFMQPAYVAGRAATLKLWMRCNSERALSHRESQIALAFMSDSTLMFNSVIPHGQWVLFDQRSSAAADGRGMNHGELYNREGQLIMTAVQEDHIATITFNRPEQRNAYTPEMAVKLTQYLSDCDKDPDVRAVIITGAGKAFCVGLDMNDVRERGSREDPDAAEGNAAFFEKREANWVKVEPDALPKFGRRNANPFGTG